jgi:hypothetical protein
MTFLTQVLSLCCFVEKKGVTDESFDLPIVARLCKSCQQFATDVSGEAMNMDAELTYLCLVRLTYDSDQCVPPFSFLLC